MADANVGDLLALDRDVAQAALALTRWRLALALDPTAHEGEAPLESARRVASRSTWDALGRLPASAADALLVDGLRRWVYTLLQARLAHADEVAWAHATKIPRGVVEGDDPRRVSWREAWRDAVLARTPGEAQERLAAVAEAGPHLAAIATRIEERRTEVAKRLQLTHPWEPNVGLSARVVRASAGRFLDATDDLWRSLQGTWLKRAAGAPAVIHAAVAREAGGGWPGRLTPRWLHEIFGAHTRGLEVKLPVLPATIGAASFARGLSAFGFALRVAMAPRTMPFAMAREPAFVGAHRLAFVFGALGADPAFHIRALGLGKRAAHAQARLLGCTALFDARLHAARLWLGGDDGPPPRELFEEIGERLFGLPLDPRLRGAWPRARDDEPARYVALIEAGALRDSLRQRFDVDWFNNPRAWSELRAEGAEPARHPVDEAVVGGQGVDALALAFESALG